MATLKQMKARKNTLTVLLIIATLATCILAYIKDDVYILTILGSLLYGAPLLFWLLLVAIRIRWVGKFWPAVKFIVFGILPLFAYGRLAMSTPNEDIAKNGLRFASYNVNQFSHNHLNKQLKMLESIDADVLSLIEVNDTWETALKEYSEAYPFMHKEASLIGTNMLLSKYPIKQITKMDEGYINAYKVTLPSKTIDIVQIHTMPPMGESITTRRNKSLELASNLDLGEYKVFMGDFNTVTWQKPMKDLTEKQGLRIATKNDATWPVPMPIAPIDHILTSFNLTYQGHGKICLWGSDHCLVYTDTIIQSLLTDDNKPSE